MKDITRESLDAFSGQKTLDERNRLVETHLNLARMVAHKFTGRGLDYDDLFQVASVALIKAVNRFDPEKGVTFASYAIPTIVGEVKNYFRDRTHVIRVPRRGVELIKALDHKKNELTQVLGRSPSVYELSDEMGIPVDNILEAYEMQGALRPSSLDGGISMGGDSGDEGSLYDILGFVEEGFGQVDTNDLVKDAVSNLSDFERQVIIMRYREELSQRAVAERLEVSQMTVSRAERKALVKLRDLIGSEAYL